MNFIPPQDETRLRAAASGVLPNGKPVIVNADGTVSVVGAATLLDVGSQVVFEAAESTYIVSAFDSNLNKVLIAFADAGNSNTLLSTQHSAPPILFSTKDLGMTLVDHERLTSIKVDMHKGYGCCSSASKRYSRDVLRSFC